MSEYAYVEKPFLDQLAALGWDVIDQGPAFPTDPAKSLRADFRAVVLRDIFNQSVRSINLTDKGQPWLTDKQFDELHDQIFHQPGHSLLGANENVLKLLCRTQVDVNELTGEEYPNVQLIDFHHPERNHFLAINQFRIDTPGGVKECIIPDIVLFVNGLPLVVIECKDANQIQANPMYEAFRQLMRYTDQREATHEAGLREGDRVAYYQSKMGVQRKAVRILDLKNRWASCSPDGRLNFHWKCMMAPPTVLDYIVVHELAHLIYPNHTKAFWNQVDKVMPDYGERKEWLRVNGAGMDL